MHTYMSIVTLGVVCIAIIKYTLQFTDMLISSRLLILNSQQELPLTVFICYVINQLQYVIYM